MEWENGGVEMSMIDALAEEESQAAEGGREEVVIVVTNNAEPDSWFGWIYNSLRIM